MLVMKINKSVLTGGCVVIMTEKRRIEVVDYNPKWVIMYHDEANKIKKIFGKELIDIYHIGSTAIPGIKAKPVIDILVVVKRIEKVDNYNDKMVRLGYEPMGEFGIKDRRFFMKGGNNRTHHVHVFELGNNEIERHLNFRDYLIANPEDARRYSKLKEELAEKYRYDIESYVKGKDGLIKEIDRKAAEWRLHDL